MKNLILIHGRGGVVTFEGQLKEIAQDCKLDFVRPSFVSASGEDLKYNKCVPIFDDLTKNGVFNDSVVVTHSAGATGMLQYIKDNKMEINSLISVAGFIKLKSYLLRCAMLVKGFDLKIKDIELCSSLIENRHSFYSDNDHLISHKNLEKFADTIKAEKHFVAGLGHFSRTLGVKEVPGMNNVITNIINKPTKKL